MITNDVIKSLQTLLSYKEQSLTVIEMVTGQSKRSILNQVNRINETFDEAKIERIQITNNHLLFPNISIDRFIELASKYHVPYFYQEERIYLILLYLFLAQEFVSNNHLQGFFSISRNTVLNDLKNLKRELSLRRLDIEYTRNYGYRIVGSDLDIISAVEFALQKVLQFDAGKWLIQLIYHEFSLPLNFDYIKKYLIEQSDNSFIDGRLNEFVYFASFIGYTNYKFDEPLPASYNSELPKTKSFKILKDLPYLASISQTKKLLLTSRMLSCLEGNYTKIENRALEKLMESIIKSVKSFTGVDFPDSSQFRENLFNHLVPAYYRLKYDIKSANPLTTEIKENYKDLFFLVKKSLEPLKHYVGKEISDDEIAYFTIHFGGYLTIDSKTNDYRLKAIVVCPNGISSSLIIREQLSREFPEIHFIDVSSKVNFTFIDENEYDMIFSTDDLLTTKPLFKVHTIINDLQKQILRKQVETSFNLKNERAQVVDEIISIMKKHISINDSSGLKLELYEWLSSKEESKKTSYGGLSLMDLLKKDFIKVKDRVENWKDGIKEAAKPLLENSYIETSYVEAMIQNVEELGPYIVLAPNVAVPHSTPDKGVNKLGMSLLKLNEGVSFQIDGEEEDAEKDVKLIFVLAPVDSSSHLRALQELAELLEDEDLIEELMLQDSPEEIYSNIKKRNSEG